MVCEEGKEISQKSGRCVKICKPGTERNPKSGRCKKVSTRPGRVPPVIPISRNPDQKRLCKNGKCKKVSIRKVTPKHLKSCKDGFEISNKSGKCVKICKSGTERNPKTGKCKKVSGAIRVPITHKSVTPKSIQNISKKNICKRDEDTWNKAVVDNPISEQRINIYIDGNLTQLDGMTLYDVKNDHNCFYHAVSAGLLGSASIWKSISNENTDLCLSLIHI